MTFRLRIATPDRTFFDADADAIVCPGLGGQFGVLARHLPLIGGLDAGILKVQAAGTTRFFVVDGGLAEVRGATVTVLANAVVASGDAADAEEKMEALKTRRPAPPAFTGQRP